MQEQKNMFLKNIKKKSSEKITFASTPNRKTTTKNSFSLPPFNYLYNFVSWNMYISRVQETTPISCLILQPRVHN